MRDPLDLPTTRIPAVEPRTQPIPHQPVWLPGHWTPTDPRPDSHIRVAAASASATAVVGMAGLSATADLLWVLVIFPGTVVVAAVAVGVAELVRRHR